MACELADGRRPLPGGQVFRTEHWLVEHCVGPLGLGTLIVKPERHVTDVASLTDEEAAELGPLLRQASAVTRRLVDAQQVYNCLWSHAGGEPGHIHYVVQPVTADQMAELDAHGPKLQMAMFARGEVPSAMAVDRMAQMAGEAFARGEHHPATPDMDLPRSPEQRRAHAIETLEAHHADAWVGSASQDGAAHLVPLSYAWDGTHLILATEESAVTTRNIRSSGVARAALGTTRDVVLIDATLESIVAVPDASDEIAEGYAAQADWDPRRSAGSFVYSRLRPQRIQVWREEHEIAGRTVMRDGAWTT